MAKKRKKISKAVARKRAGIARRKLKRQGGVVVLL